MLYRITLHLARSPAFPDGSARQGYEIVAPLDGERHLDAKAWLDQREACTVRRFWDGEEREGMLLHRPGGADGATWLIDYDEDTSDDDEPGYRLNLHAFARGEYVTLTDHEGEHTFRIVDVEPLASAAG
jgi:hypothetical protein